MSDLQKKINNILQDVEKNIKNKEDLEYVKQQICNVYNIFMDTYDTMEEKFEKQMDGIIIRCKLLDDRMSEIENSIDKIESDIYINEKEEYDLDITCPYCEAEFTVDFSEELKNTVVCPECNHTIELDWNEEEHNACEHNCSSCNGHCDEEEETAEDVEDDM